MSQESGSEDWKAPYISYKTLVNFVDEKLALAELPPRIDRGFLDSYSGSVQAPLRAALRTIGLIDDEDTVLDPLMRAVSGPDARKDVLRDWAFAFYEEQIALAQGNATSQMLHETFSRHGYTGSTLRKAVVFYLALCEDLGLPRSPHFKPPRQAAPSGRPTRPLRKKAQVPDVAVAAVPGAPRESKTVSFGQAGRVEIRVELRWLDLAPDTFVALRTAIGDIEKLAVAPAHAGNNSPESQDGDVDGR